MKNTISVELSKSDALILSDALDALAQQKQTMARSRQIAKLYDRLSPVAGLPTIYLEALTEISNSSRVQAKQRRKAAK